MIIISSEIELEVGKIYPPEDEPLATITDFDGNIHLGIKFLVVKKSDRKEYADQNKDFPNLELTIGYNRDYFYEVSMD